MSNLYLFVIVPPEELAKKIRNERENFAERYKAVRALKPPVHITMHETFHEDDEFEQDIRQLQKWADKQKPVHITLQNYNFFTHAATPVVYIDVKKNDELNALHISFLAELRKYTDVEKKSGKYTPHITIGYRDVPVALFPEIKAEYLRRRFNGDFVCHSICLWKHDGNNWRLLQEFPLNGNKVAAPPTLF